jgi:hypothetical protein
MGRFMCLYVEVEYDYLYALVQLLNEGRTWYSYSVSETHGSVKLKRAATSTLLRKTIVTVCHRAGFEHHIEWTRNAHVVRRVVVELAVLQAL